MTYLLPLSATGLDDSPRVGRKAAVLAEMLAAGLAVPDGFSVGTDALRAVLAAAPPDEDPAAYLASAPLPEGLYAELEQALAALGPDPVAVRSSGIDEDLAGQSYAGQYDSVLNVRGVDEVVAALRTCWASGFSERIAVYRGDGNAAAQVGVLVQRMVPAAAAGVAFSCNPVTGDLSEVLVSAVRGLGDRLMSGEQTADEWVVRDGAAVLTSAAAPTADGSPTALPAADITRVAELATRVAEHFGAPQDIEWAIADGALWLLQARPITTLTAAPVAQVPIPVEVPALFSTRDTNAVRPWVRLQSSVFLPVFSDAARHVFAFTTGVIPSASSIGGWVYLSMPTDDVPSLVTRVEKIAVAVAAGAPRALVQRWNAEWKPAFTAKIEALRGTDLAGLADQRLTGHVRDLVTFFGELHDVYFQLTGASVQLLGELGVACQELLGWSAAQTLQLRGGLRGDHMAAAIGIGELARLAAARPAVRELLESGEPGAVTSLAGTDPEFATAFADYVARYGHRTIGFDLTEPTLAEQPDVLLSLVRAQLDDPFDFDRERAALRGRLDATLAQAAEGLAAAGAPGRQRFEAALAGSDLGGPVRDEKVFYAVSVWALLRYAVLELGQRLAKSGVLAAPEDVFALDLDEALAALADGGSRLDLVTRRQGELAWAAANPGPAFYGPPPTPMVPEPGMTPPSPAAEHMMAIGQWSMSLWGGGPGGESVAGSLRGVAASAGRYTGPARVITSVTEFGKLRRGDVLVCPETTAQWAVLFPSIGALVTDNGSILSHPAIIAREYGVPAVVATGNATSTFHDDEMITVDGTAGVVRAASDRSGLSTERG